MAITIQQIDMDIFQEERDPKNSLQVRLKANHDNEEMVDKFTRLVLQIAVVKTPKSIGR